MTDLHFALGFNLHCLLQHVSSLLTPTSHSSFCSTNELPQKLPDGSANANHQQLVNNVNTVDNNNYNNYYSEVVVLAACFSNFTSML